MQFLVQARQYKNVGAGVIVNAVPPQKGLTTARITTAKPPQTSQRTVREYDSILTKKGHSVQSAPESSIRPGDAQALSSVAVVAVGFSAAGFFFSTSALYHSFHAASSTTFTAPFMRAWPSPQSWAQVIW